MLDEDVFVILHNGTTNRIITIHIRTVISIEMLVLNRCYRNRQQTGYTFLNSHMAITELRKGFEGTAN